MTPKARANILHYGGLASGLLGLLLLQVESQEHSTALKVTAITALAVFAASLVIGFFSNRCPICGERTRLRGPGSYCPRCGQWIPLRENELPPQ